MPMISSPFSAWTLRIENISSCLRSVEAPSMPSSSAMATSSAGDFSFRSLRCMGKILGFWMVVRSRGEGRKCAAGCPHGWRANDWTGVKLRGESSQRSTSERLHDDEDDDEDRGEAGYLVHDPQRLAADRPLTAGEALAVAH